MNINAINEAALEYAKNHSAAPDKETPDWIITDFRSGALSDAAKQYWFEQFKDEQCFSENDMREAYEAGYSIEDGIMPNFKKWLSVFKSIK